MSLIEELDLDETKVYQRDASGYQFPNVSPSVPKVLHWYGGKVHARLGLPMSACGRSPLFEDHTWLPKDVPESLRCTGSGCRQRWAAWLTDSETDAGRQS